MKYYSRDRHPTFKGHTHWGHVVELYCGQKRRQEFENFLNDVMGEDQWRVYDIPSNPKTKWFKPFGLEGDVRVLFKSKDGAVRLKLMWQECDRKADLNDLYGQLRFMGTPTPYNWYSHRYTAPANPHALQPFLAATGVGKSCVAMSQLKSRATQEEAVLPVVMLDYENSMDLSQVRVSGETLRKIKEIVTKPQ